MKVDASASSGGGGRDLQFSWTVSGVASATTGAVLVHALSSASSSFNVDVAATNWLGATAAATLRVEVDTAPVPAALIDGGRALLARRSQPFRVFADADAPSCGGAGPELAYAWTLTPAAGDPVLGEDPRYFELPEGVLSSRIAYDLELTVSDALNQTNSASATIDAISSEIEAVVDGGDRTVRAGTTLVLDASRSRDPDGDAPTFAWRFGADVVGSSATLDVAAPAAGASAIYEVTVATPDGREAFVETTLYGAAGEPPSIEVEAPAGKVDATARVRVNAEAGPAAGNYTLAWRRLDGAGWAVSDKALAPTSVVVAAGARASLPLVLEAHDGLDAGLRPGSSYKFALAATAGGAEIAYVRRADISLTHRGGTAVVTSRPRRRRDSSPRNVHVEIPWRRVAVTPRPRRRTFRGDEHHTAGTRRLRSGATARRRRAASTSRLPPVSSSRRRSPSRRGPGPTRTCLSSIRSIRRRRC